MTYTVKIYIFFSQKQVLVKQFKKIDCAIFTPNTSMPNYVKRMVKDLHTLGMIHYGLQFYSLYNVQDGPVERRSQNEPLQTFRKA